MVDNAEGVYSIAISPDGNILASGHENGTILLWDLATHQTLGQPLQGHAALVKTIAFRSDGTILVSGGFDALIILWDVTSGQPIGRPLTGHIGGIYSVAFKSNSATLASGSIDNNIIVWDLDPQSWIAKMCQRVGRNFTQSEWRQYFGDEPYPVQDLTCPQWSPPN
jgi:WD40 repeat protein